MVPEDNYDHARDGCRSHPLWRVIVSDQVGLISNAWMHYIYCRGEMWRLQPVLSDGFTKRAKLGISQVFGIKMMLQTA